MAEIVLPSSDDHGKALNRPQLEGAIGTLIREWRLLRKRSQMDLALDTSISTRHLSFVETGRSKPSVEVLLAIAEHLDVPLRTRNAWLLAAGFAPRFSEQGLGSTRMAQVKKAVQRLLDTHHPYPGVALDGQWNVVLHNQAAGKMISVLPEFLRLPQINIFRASLHPEGFAAHTRNFEEWGTYLLQLLQRLKLTTRDQGISALTQEVLEYPNVKVIREYAARPLSPESSLLVPCVMELHGQELSLFTTLTIFGSPRDITLNELSIELFYPSDSKTEQFLKSVTALESSPSNLGSRNSMGLG
jgi:transcriptional regulator with XRE-family HTH domain